jgi:hypothetical protein
MISQMNVESVFIFKAEQTFEFFCIKKGVPG